MHNANEIDDEVMEEEELNRDLSAEFDDVEKSSLQGKTHKQSYRKAWESLPDFKGWLRALDGHPNRAFCTYCQVSLFAHRLSLLKHTCTLKHQRATQKALLKGNRMISDESEVSAVSSTSHRRIDHFPADNNKLELHHVQPKLPSNMTVTIIQDGDVEPIALQLAQSIEEENNALITDDDDLGLNTMPPVQLRMDPIMHSKAESPVAVTNSVKMAPSSSSPLSAHVLDTSKGRPAAQVPVSLYRLIESRWTLLNESVTDENGRVGGLLERQDFVCGRYKLHFDTGKYFELDHKQTMFPFVEIPFDVHSPTEHYHIPLILSLFGYSTYRGS